MSVAAGLLAILLLVVVLAIVTGPLRPGGDGRPEGDRGRPDARIPDLEAAREAKYRELRDAELDHRTGKLSDGDYESIRGTLRAEANEILNRLEEASRAAAKPDAAQPDAEAPEDGRESGARAAAVAPRAGEGSGELEQGDGVAEQQHREDHGPAVEVALDQRATSERPGAAAHAEGAGEASILAGVHQHEKDQHNGDDDLQDR